MKTIGLIGGTGWSSTAEYYQMIILDLLAISLGGGASLPRWHGY